MFSIRPQIFCILIRYFCLHIGPKLNLRNEPYDNTKRICESVVKRKATLKYEYQLGQTKVWHIFSNIFLVFKIPYFSFISFTISSLTFIFFYYYIIFIFIIFVVVGFFSVSDIFLWSISLFNFFTCWMICALCSVHVIGKKNIDSVCSAQNGHKRTGIENTCSKKINLIKWMLKSI